PRYTISSLFPYTTLFRSDILYINGEVFEEPYLDEYKEKLTDHAPLTYNFNLESLTGYEEIPEGYLFVLGDNRRKTTDSRDPNVGVVQMDKLLGTANVRFYPFDNLRIVRYNYIKRSED